MRHIAGAAIGVTLALLSLWSPRASAAGPVAGPEFLELKRGDYLWTASTHHLDGALTESLGIQFWVRPAELPGAPFQHRVILAKPGSYVVSLQRLADFGVGREGRLPLPTSHIVLTVRRWAEDGIEDKVVWRPRISVDTWTHVRLLLRVVGGGLRSEVVINGERVSNGFSSPHPEPLFTRSSSRLYVGDVPRGELYGPAEAAFPYDLLVSSPISLDELEISAGPTGAADDHTLPAVPDENTKALWHFDEGRRRIRYKDASGKGHTLRLASLAVEARGKVATQWATVRKSLLGGTMRETR